MRFHISYSMFPLPNCPECGVALASGISTIDGPAWVCLECGHEQFVDGNKKIADNAPELDPYRDFLEELG